MTRHFHDIRGKRKFDPSRLWAHYVLALSLVLALVLVSQAMQTLNMRENQRDTEMVLLAGHQYALSQRILVLADVLHESGAPEAAVELRRVIDEFHATKREIDENAWARQHMKAPTSRSAGGFPVRTKLDEIAADFIALAALVNDATPGSIAGAEGLASLRLLGTSGLSPTLAAFATKLEAEAADRRRRAIRLQRATLILLIAVILAESALIFWPAHRAMIRAVQSLEAKNNAIRKKNTQLEDYAKRLAFSAFHDPLTGLTNRKRLHESLEQLLSRDDIGSREICVMHIDLDRFKELNDRLGHAVGDATLKHVAEIMRSRMRSEDIVARVGGDEFVIAAAFDDPDSEVQVQEICDGLISRIRDPMVVNGVDVQIGASIGYAFASNSVRDAEILISNADIALYDAKRAGKGVARPFTGSMRDSIERRHALVTDMERALDAGEFIPHFQPHVALESGKVLGLEMLARWDHPTRGLVAPCDFMEIAEEIGMVDAIDARVLLDGLDALAALRKEGWQIPRLSLNASARTMRYADYAERLTDAITARGFTSGDIVVEVQETTLIADAHDQAARTISALRSAGYNVYVDDFGTGYSSLSNLASLDVNGLKIDQTLIADIEDDRARQVVGAIIGLARAMDLTVVAEGVETPTQFRRLRQMGADSGQGYGIADPMPLNDARAWLDSYGRDIRALG